MSGSAPRATGRGLPPVRPGASGTLSGERRASTIETELKLRCDRDGLDEIAGSPALCGDGGGGNVELTAIYYDTPGLALRRSGTSLRVRTDGTHFVMTLKSRRGTAGRPLERRERWAQVNRMAPNLAALARMLPAQLLAEIGSAQLEPVFRTEVHRQMRMLDTPLGKLEVALDRGRIVAGEREEEISEIELELVEGSTAALYRLAQDFAARVPLRPSMRSKADRGYGLAFGLAPTIPVAPRLKFRSGTTLDQALSAILRSALAHLLESGAAAEEGRDPEGIHQFRVALRRLRSVLGLMRSIAPSAQLDRFREDARWLMYNLDEARMWDVFVTDTIPPIARACPSVKGFDLVQAAAEGHRRRAHAVASAAIAASRTGRLQIDLGLWVEQTGWRAHALPETLPALAAPARGFAAEVLKKLHRRVLRRGRDFAQLSADGRHRLRLALKRLRYMAEFFLPLWGRSKQSRRYARTLVRLQEHLGANNDMAVMEGLVHRILGDAIPAAGSRAGSAMLGWKGGSLSHRDPELLAAWRDFCRLAPPEDAAS